MKTTFTPGPWEAIDGVIASTETPARMIAQTGGEINRLAGREFDNPANARLIASAPDLLGACKSALRALCDNLEPGPMDEDAKAGLRAAISRATGAND